MFKEEAHNLSWAVFDGASLPSASPRRCQQAQEHPQPWSLPTLTVMSATIILTPVLTNLMAFCKVARFWRTKARLPGRLTRKVDSSTESQPKWGQVSWLLLCRKRATRCYKLLLVNLRFDKKKINIASLTMTCTAPSTWPPWPSQSSCQLT